eukprot:3794968-Pleurochrysis_carterae.AAC.1
MPRLQLVEQFAMEKKGKAAKLFHNETAGSFAAAAAAAAGSAANGALPGASAAPNTDIRRADFGKGKQMPPPLPPADVDRNSLRNKLMDRLTRYTRGARSALVHKDLDRMLKLGNLEIRRVIGDGNCGYYAYLASCAAAKVPDRVLEHQACDMRRGRLMGKNRARIEFLRRLAMRALINTEWGRKFCLLHLAQRHGFGITASARASLNAAL